MIDEIIVHTFEAGRRGKPDELDAVIAHLIGAHLLELDPLARFDLRVSGGYSPAEDRIVVSVSGEVSGSLLEQRNLYTMGKIVNTYYRIINKETSHEIAVDLTRLKPQAEVLASNHKAGDSGNPIAVAYRRGPMFLPFERVIACGVRDLLDFTYANGGQILPQRMAEKSGVARLDGLLSDGKVIVDASYNGVELVSIDSITVHAQHDKKLPVDELRDALSKIISAYIGNFEDALNSGNFATRGIRLGKPIIKVNGLGDWNVGGWSVDEGSREAKPYRDFFGNYGVMEDSPWGEDPTKPSGPGTLIARYIAVQIVANNFADFARVGLRYNIGEEDVGLNITTNGTGRVGQQELHRWVRKNFPLKIEDVINLFDLRNPDLYRRIADSADFFCRITDKATNTYGFPWNVAKDVNLGYFNPLTHPERTR
ncbi:methionine adenosyltransferase domain-containing protein [Candidatus Woesearchaeota archaeon]|nr:methionine adenosyltransferase domain-containing protein [Candidatus Woesearchaeota archaeon]